MPAAAMIDERLTITDETVHEARSTEVPREASLVLRSPDGTDVDLPPRVQRTLLAALESIAQQGSVQIGKVPDELSSTVAADILGVSRPTLMKWVRNGEIEPFKVGTHHRFHRSDVLALKEKRRAERRAALEELRAMDSENDEFLDD